MACIPIWLSNMSFSQRVIELRKKRGLTQQGLSDATNIHVQQIKRYEAGTSQPTAEALKKLAIVLQVTSDFLLFEPGEREPENDLKLKFEAVSAMSEEEQEITKALLDAMIVKSQVSQTILKVTKRATKEKH